MGLISRVSSRTYRGERERSRMAATYFICDAKDDPELLAKYKEYHAPGKAWPEITADIRNQGIANMEIFWAGDRLVMVVTPNEIYTSKFGSDFTWENAAKLAARTDETLTVLKNGKISWTHSRNAYRLLTPA